jgi:ParB-like chromosome segregation protein Spo0J
MPKGVPLWPVSRLSTYFRNPMKHTQEQVETLCRMMKVYGWTDPIIVDEKDGILAGHLRYAAAIHMALTEVPVIEVTHLSDEEKKAFVIGHNQIARRSKWDDRLLAEELEAVRDADMDVTLAAFTDEELDALLVRVEASLPPLEATAASFTPNVAPETSQPAVTARDVQRTEAEMSDRFSGSPDMTEVVCPHCGETFNIQTPRGGSGGA